MNFVEIEKNKCGFYAVKDFDNKSLYTLVEFLLIEIGTSGSFFFLNWLNGEYNQDHAYGNAYGLTEEKNKVFVHMQPAFSKKSHHH